ncbi:MAG: tetratricopeptide repeat protein [Chloroflexi bacterium]|nr:MAG: tetratricopeptide repeat protein [Chloroflexota bacterium]
MLLGYEQVLASDRYQWLVWQRLGLCHLQLGNYAEAAAAFREAITLNFEDTISFFNGAIAYSQIGDRVKTWVYLKEALVLKPELEAAAQGYLHLRGYLD